MAFWFRLGLVVSIVTTSSLVFLILAFLLYFSLPLFDAKLFFDFFTFKWDVSQGLYGLMPMILGTLYISLLATFLATLSSLSMASLIALFLPKKLASWLERFLLLLSGIPTVLYAFVALFLLVPVMNDYFSGKGLSIFTASFVLSFVVLPTMGIMMLNAMRSIPKAHLSAALNLGATKEDLFFELIFPRIKKEILGAIIFGFARAVGDTLIALMLAGNALHIPHHLLDSARTLTAHIALINANDYESIAFKAIFLCALLLFLFTLVVVGCVKLLSRKDTYA